mmetsp:Transcript_16384/g.37488  ORF Transcript_16384/g.37488 Transcript_16384/m.37488 type:complete len:238 (-) Transcript_16384:344-1057(-)
MPERRLHRVVAKLVGGKVRELALQQRLHGLGNVHLGRRRLKEHLLHHPDAVLLRGEREHVLGHLHEHEGRVRVLEGDAHAPRTVRVERALDHVSVELAHQLTRVSERQSGDDGLGDAGTLRMLQQTHHLPSECGEKVRLRLRPCGQLRHDVVAEGVRRELKEVRRELVTRRLQLRVGHAHQLSLQPARTLLLLGGDGERGACGTRTAARRCRGPRCHLSTRSTFTRAGWRRMWRRAI